MHPGRGGAEAAVAFVGDDHQSARLGHDEVGPADAEVGLHELVPQGRAGHCGHLFDVFLVGHTELPGKELGDVFFRFVQRGGNQVGRSLAGQLYNVLAQVRLVDVDAHGLQDRVQLQFFGHHAFALGGDLDTTGLGQMAHYLVGFRGVLGEVDLSPGGGHVVVQHFQVIV